MVLYGIYAAILFLINTVWAIQAFYDASDLEAPVLAVFGFVFIIAGLISPIAWAVHYL